MAYTFPADDRRKLAKKSKQIADQAESLGFSEEAEKLREASERLKNDKP